MVFFSYSLCWLIFWHRIWVKRWCRCPWGRSHSILWESSVRLRLSDSYLWLLSNLPPRPSPHLTCLNFRQSLQVSVHPTKRSFKVNLIKLTGCLINLLNQCTLSLEYSVWLLVISVKSWGKEALRDDCNPITMLPWENWVGVITILTENTLSRNKMTSKFEAFVNQIHLKCIRGLAFCLSIFHG